MGTDWKLRPHSIDPLAEKTLAKLNDAVGLDVGDRRDARKAAKMHRDIHLALKAYPHQHVWMDRARPANQLAGLAQFKKRLAALIKTFESLDDTTWRNLDQVHEPGSADDRRDSSVRFELNRMVVAATSLERHLKRAKRHKSSQHPPTTEARQELIEDLKGIFARYSSKDSESPKDERRERLTFVRTILMSAKIPCPQGVENLRAPINRQRSSVDLE